MLEMEGPILRTPIAEVGEYEKLGTFRTRHLSVRMGK